MGGAKLRLPSVRISLRRLYEYYIAGEEGLGGLSPRTARAYAKAAAFLLEGVERGLGFEEFKARLAERILDGLGAREALDLLRGEGLPVNAETFAYALSSVGVEAPLTTARTLLGLLRSAEVLQTRPLPVLVTSPKDKLYEYVLTRGSVKFRRLEGLFDNARALVLELVREGRVGVRLRRVALERLGAEDWDDVKEGVPDAFLEEWTDSSGAVRRKIVIPGDAVVYVLPGQARV